MATVTVTVVAVNDAPSFTKGASPTVLEDAGPQTVSNWPAAVSAGPANETNGLCVPLVATVCGQTVTFGVTNNNNTLFSVQPAIAADGTLT